MDLSHLMRDALLMGSSAFAVMTNDKITPAESTTVDAAVIGIVFATVDQVAKKYFGEKGLLHKVYRIIFSAAVTTSLINLAARTLLGNTKVLHIQALPCQRMADIVNTFATLNIIFGIITYSLETFMRIDPGLFKKLERNLSPS